MVSFFSAWVKCFSFYFWLFGVLFINHIDTLAGSLWYFMYTIINSMLIIYEFWKPRTIVQDYIRYWILYDQTGEEIFKQTAIDMKDNYNL